MNQPYHDRSEMNRIVNDMSMAEYLSADGVNSSRLKLILKTSLDYKASFNEEFEETKSTVLGTATDCMVLESDSFSERYALEPHNFGDKRSGEARKMWTEFKKESEGKIVIAWDQAQILRKISDRASKSFSFKFILASSRNQVSGFAKDPDTKLFLKARPDILSKDTIWDLKTTSNGIDDDSIYRQIMKYQYHFQAAHHMKTMNLLLDGAIKNWGWIFIDTDSPACHIRILRCPAILLQQGIEEHENALSLLSDCVKTNVWSGYPDEISELELPKWAIKKGLRDE